MISILFSRLCILTCGTLYPGYISFKTVRAKDVDDYVKWMMYWIVFAAFTSTEAITDIFFAWFPFYYEFKIVFILWILPTTGNGSSFIYKYFIQPLLKKHETRLDYRFSQIGEKGRDLVLQYVKASALCVGRNIMDAINKHFPNAVLGLLAKNNFPSTSAKNSQTMINEEIEVQHALEKIKIRRRPSAKTRKNNESEEVRSGQRRIRRTRQSKQEVDYNLNNS